MRIRNQNKPLTNKDLGIYSGFFMRNQANIREILFVFLGISMLKTGRSYLWIRYVANIVIHITKRSTVYDSRGSRGCDIPLRTTFVARKRQYKGVVSTPLKSRLPGGPEVILKCSPFGDKVIPNIIGSEQ